MDSLHFGQSRNIRCCCFIRAIVRKTLKTHRNTFPNRPLPDSSRKMERRKRKAQKKKELETVSCPGSKYYFEAIINWKEWWACFPPWNTLREDGKFKCINNTTDWSKALKLLSGCSTKLNVIHAMSIGRLTIQHLEHARTVRIRNNEWEREREKLSNVHPVPDKAVAAFVFAFKCDGERMGEGKKLWRTFFVQPKNRKQGKFVPEVGAFLTL